MCSLDRNKGSGVDVGDSVCVMAGLGSDRSDRGVFSLDVEVPFCCLGIFVPFCFLSLSGSLVILSARSLELDFVGQGSKAREEQVSVLVRVDKIIRV